MSESITVALRNTTQQNPTAERGSSPAPKTEGNPRSDCPLGYGLHG
jgi:hypothetical protein